MTQWIQRLDTHRGAFAGIGLCGIALWIAHGWAVLLYPLGNDPAIFQYHGWALEAGEIPYQDTLEFNSPGILFLHWIVGLLAGFSDRAFLLFTLGLSTLAAWGPLLAKSLRRSPGTWVVTMAVTIWAYGAITPWDRGQRELFQGIFALAAFGLGVWQFEANNSGVRRRLQFGMGLLLGAAITLKITITALIGPVVLLWLLAERWWNTKTLGECAASGAWLSAGVAVSIGAILCWVYSIGAWEGFWWTQWHYLPIHRGQIAVSVLTAMSSTLPWVVLLAGLGALTLVLFQRTVWSASLFILGSALVGTVILYLIQGKGWTYHLHVAVPLLGLTLGLVTQQVFSSTNSTLRLVPWLASLLIVIVAAGNTRYDHQEGLTRATTVGTHWNYTAHQQVAALLQSEGAASERVLVNNDEQQLLVMAQRRSATSCMYGFLCSESQPDPFLASLGLQRASQVNDRSPAWVVWNDSPYQPALDRLTANPLIEAWIERRCSLHKTIPPYRVWRCSSASPDSPELL